MAGPVVPPSTVDPADYFLNYSPDEEAPPPKPPEQSIFQKIKGGYNTLMEGAAYQKKKLDVGLNKARELVDPQHNIFGEVDPSKSPSTQIALELFDVNEKYNPLIAPTQAIVKGLEHAVLPDKVSGVIDAAQEALKNKTAEVISDPLTWELGGLGGIAAKGLKAAELAGTAISTGTRAAQLGGTAAAALFTPAMASGTYEGLSGAAEEYQKNGITPEFARLATGGLVDAAFTRQGAKHLLGGHPVAKELVEDTPQKLLGSGPKQRGRYNDQSPTPGQVFYGPEGPADFSQARVLDPLQQAPIPEVVPDIEDAEILPQRALPPGPDAPLQLTEGTPEVEGPQRTLYGTQPDWIQGEPVDDAAGPGGGGGGGNGGTPIPLPAPNIRGLLAAPLEEAPINAEVSEVPRPGSEPVAAAPVEAPVVPPSAPVQPTETGTAGTALEAAPETTPEDVPQSPSGRVFHLSQDGTITELDPEVADKNIKGSSEESKRQDREAGVSLYREGTTPERRFTDKTGSQRLDLTRYDGELPPNAKIYDISKDPEGLAAQHRGTALEKAVKAAGYSGLEDGQGSIRYFDKLKVTGGKAAESAEAAEAAPLETEPTKIKEKFDKYAETPQAAQDYLAKNTKPDGSVDINPDHAKELSPEYGQNPVTRNRFGGAVHIGSTKIAEAAYDEAISKPAAPGLENAVLVTAGGYGSGKSVAVRMLGKGFQAIYDSSFKNPVFAERIIEKALKAGKRISIAYVKRGVEDAWEGALRRSADPEDGRMTPAEGFIDSHVTAPRTVLAMMEKYKDNPKVNFKMIDNTGGMNEAKEVDISNLQAVQYDERALQDSLSEATSRAHTEGRISDETKNTANADFFRAGRDREGTPSPEEIRGSEQSNNEGDGSKPEESGDAQAGRSKGGKEEEVAKPIASSNGYLENSAGGDRATPKALERLTPYIDEMFSKDPENQNTPVIDEEDIRHLFPDANAQTLSQLAYETAERLHGRQQAYRNTQAVAEQFGDKGPIGITKYNLEDTDGVTYYVQRAIRDGKVKVVGFGTNLKGERGYVAGGEALKLNGKKTSARGIYTAFNQDGVKPSETLTVFGRAAQERAKVNAVEGTLPKEGKRAYVDHTAKYKAERAAREATAAELDALNSRDQQRPGRSPGAAGSSDGEHPARTEGRSTPEVPPEAIGGTEAAANRQEASAGTVGQAGPENGPDQSGEGHFPTRAERAARRKAAALARTKDAGGDEAGGSPVAEPAPNRRNLQEAPSEAQGSKEEPVIERGRQESSSDKAARQVNDPSQDPNEVKARKIAADKVEHDRAIAEWIARKKTTKVEPAAATAKNAATIESEKAAVEVKRMSDPKFWEGMDPDEQDAKLRMLTPQQKLKLQKAWGAKTASPTELAIALDRKLVASEEAPGGLAPADTALGLEKAPEGSKAGSDLLAGKAPEVSSKAAKGTETEAPLTRERKINAIPKEHPLYEEARHAQDMVDRLGAKAAAEIDPAKKATLEGRVKEWNKELDNLAQEAKRRFVDAPKTLKEKLKARGDAALERLNTRKPTTANLGVEPKILLDLIDYGASRLAEGAVDFANWSKHMVEKFGADIQPRLQEIFDRAQIKFLLGKSYQNLTPSEVQNLTKSTAENFVNLLQQMPDATEMAHVALAGIAKRHWYANSGHAIASTFGLDSPRFTGLLAALSPRISVEGNLLNTLNTWVNWDAAGRPTNRAAIIDIMARSVQGKGLEASVMDAWRNNAVRILSAEHPADVVLSGPKVNSFMGNLRGLMNEVTNDAWMANYANVDQGLFGGLKDSKTGIGGKSAGYLAMSAATRDAAVKLTELTGEHWSPAEVQETVWSWAKALYEKSTKTGRTAVDLLESGELTDEIIAGTPAFGDLFHNEEYASILRKAGYDIDSLTGLDHDAKDLAGTGTKEEGARSEVAGEAEKTPRNSGPQADPELLRQGAARLDATRVRKAAENAEEARVLAAKEEYAKNPGQVSFEATPGESTGFLPGIHNAPYELREKYMQDIQGALLDKNGKDELAAAAGIKKVKTFAAPGFWGGKFNPGWQLELPFDLNPAEQLVRVKSYVAAMAKILKQEGGGYNIPKFNADRTTANAGEVRLGRAVTKAEVQGIYDSLKETLGKQADNIALIPSREGLRLVKFAGKAGERFHAAVEKAITQGIKGEGTATYRTFDGNSDVISNDWRKNPNGEGYQGDIQAGRPDVQRASRRVSLRVKEVNDRYIAEYGWDKPGGRGTAGEPVGAGERTGAGAGAGGVKAEVPEVPTASTLEDHLANIPREKFSWIDAADKAAEERMAARGASTTAHGGFSGADPQVLADLSIRGAKWILDGASTIGKFTSRLFKEVGEGFSGVVGKVWHEAQRILGYEPEKGRESQGKAAGTPSEAPKRGPAKPIPAEGPKGPKKPSSGGGPGKLSPEEAADLFARTQKTSEGRTSGKPPEEFINLDKASTDGEIRKLMSRAVDVLSDKLGHARNYRSYAEARDKAVQAGITEKDFNRMVKEGAVSDHVIEAGRSLREKAFKDAKEKLTKLQEAKRANHGIDDAEADYEKAINKAAGVLWSTVRAGSEAGRALAIHARMAKGFSPEEMLYRKLAKNREGLSPEFTKRFLSTDINDSRALAALLRAEFTPTLRSMAYEFWINGLLSGPPTHFANLIGNTIAKSGAIVEKGIAGGVDYARAKATGTKQTRFAGEAYADLMSLKEGLRKGFAAGKESWSDEYQALKEEGKVEYGPKIPDRFGGKVVRAPTRLLNASDEVFKAIAATGELHSLAFRKASIEGHVGKAKAARIADILENFEDHKDIVQGMHDAANYRTFTKRLGKFGQALTGARDAEPTGIAKVILPFMRTPANILKYTLERTPLNFLNILHKAAKGEISGGHLSEELAKPMLGTTVGMAFGLMAAEGLLTGGGPSDPKENLTKRNSGWRPYSIHVDGEYYNIQRFEPFSSIAGFAADMVEAKDVKTRGELAAKIVGSIGENLTNKTFISGLENFFTLWHDPKRYAEQFTKSMEASLVPAIVGRAAQAIDPTNRETHAFKTNHGIPEAIMARIPGASSYLNAKKTDLGEDMTRGGNAATRFLSPVEVSSDKIGKVYDLEREFVRIGTIPTPPKRDFMLKGGNKIELSDNEFTVVDKLYGRATQRLANLQGSSYWSKLPDTEADLPVRADGSSPRIPTKESLIKDAYSVARRQARAWLYQNYDFRRRAAKVVQESRADRARDRDQE